MQDIPDGDGFSERYLQSLEIAGRSYHVADARLSRLAPNTPLRVDGAISGRSVSLSGLRVVGQPSPTAAAADAAQAATTAAHVTKALVIRTTWTVPDTRYTQESAQAEVADDDAWFQEVSYGAEGIAATATPELRIADPGSSCDEYTILPAARAAAAAAGYDYTQYDRTLVYFPRVTSCPYAGTSNIGADWSVFNGSLSTSLTTHEQGHELGFWHAHSYLCPDRTNPSTPMCNYGDGDEYGDRYDTMGRGGAVHYNGAEKDKAGWLAGRKVVLTPGTSATLAPLEQQAAATQVAMIDINQYRKYYIEYRQLIGLDSYLGWDGTSTHGTDGVLIHAVDSYYGYGEGTHLLDMSPDANFYDATLKSGQSWTTPEGYTISVGTVNSSGASISVSKAAPSLPAAPPAPSATAGDSSATVSWSAPASDGGSSITSYVVTASPGGQTATTDGSGRSATVTGLTNGTSYTFTVAAANSAGTGAASASSAPVAPRAPVVTTYQESALQLRGWSVVSNSAASGGSYRASMSTGDTATFTFTGTGVTWLARGDAASGQASVTIDGASRGTVDLYRATASAVSVPYTGLANKSHKLVVKILGTKNAASTGTTVSVDGFTVGTATTQDSAPAVAYSNWTGASSTSATGGAYRSSSVAGNTVTYSFSGTAVSWVTAMGPAYGKAEVFIDGWSRGTFDQYASTAQWQVARSLTGLDAGSHTIAIQVLGTKNAASSGTAVVVDALKVTS